MAKPLVLSFGGKDLPFQLEKVARDDLYGYVEIETVDEKGRKCTAAKLASDGKSIVATGGTAMAMVAPTGEWLERKTLKPVDAENKPITPVSSSFAAPVPVTKKVTIDEYLSHNITGVYKLNSDTDFGDLMTDLKAGAIYTFPWSFRGGLEADAGFILLSADGTPFLMVGQACKLEFVGFDQPAAIEEETDVEEDDDSLDFSMM